MVSNKEIAKIRGILPKGTLLPDWTGNMCHAWELVEEMVNSGNCPALLFDDNGHWALSTEGVQNVVWGKKPKDVQSTFMVYKKEWQDTAPQAICEAYMKWKGE